MKACYYAIYHHLAILTKSPSHDQNMINKKELNQNGESFFNKVLILDKLNQWQEKRKV